jgi:hypothetical protein
MPDWGKFKIAWTIIPPANPNHESWKSIDHFSMLPYGWIPSDGIDFFMQFILYLKERWLKLCYQAMEHLNECVSYQANEDYPNPIFTSNLLIC